MGMTSEMGLDFITDPLLTRQMDHETGWHFLTFLKKRAPAFPTRGAGAEALTPSLLSIGDIHLISLPLQGLAFFHAGLCVV